MKRQESITTPTSMGCQSITRLPPPPPVGTHLYSWVERGTVSVMCFAQEHNTMNDSAQSWAWSTWHGLPHTTGGPSSRCEMIILQNKSHSVIITVYIEIFITWLLGIKNTVKFSIKKYLNFHSVSLVIWLFFMLKTAHFSEISIYRFTMYIREAQQTWKWITH